MPQTNREPPPRPSDKHTAVVFVHGMGRQSRYENLGRLLEALEEHHSGPGEPALRRFRARTEPSRTGDGEDVPFMQFDRFEPRRHAPSAAERWRFTGRYRAYEAYWSPITARGASPWRVAGWALRQLAKPEAARHATWRHFTHLRIARLHRLLAETPPPTDASARRRRDYLAASLLVHIRRFQGHEGGDVRETRRLRGEGAAEFLAFVQKKVGAIVDGAELRALVGRWNAARLPVESLVIAATVRLRILAAALLVFVLGLGVGIWRDGLSVGTVLALLALGAAAALVATLGSGFLARTFSDVYIWNSDQAHDRDYARRQEVLARTRALVEHVASDPACKRMVIIAHSLGTPIALETLSLIGRRNEARAGTPDILPLGKLSHLVTLGSPIDKVFYFFQTREARTYRAGRLLDDLRGSLSQEPFFRDGVQRTAWMNFWDAADIVSDPLYSPLGDRTDGADVLTARIGNYKVENEAGYSARGAHVGYLRNADVVACIAEALFRNRTVAPVVRPSKRDPRLGAARTFAIRWAPAALLAGASAVALGRAEAAAALCALPFAPWLGWSLAAYVKARLHPPEPPC